MALTVTTEPIENRQLSVSIQVPEERVQAELRKAAAKVAAQYRIPGFRKGKAPYHLVVQQFGLANLYGEFVDELGQSVYLEAMEQENITPYATAALDDIRVDPLVYKLTVPLEPIVSLGDYRSLRVADSSVEVSDSEVEATLEKAREKYASWQSVDRPSTYGDTLTIDVRAVIPAAMEGEAETIVLDELGWEVTPDEENPMDPPGFDAAIVGLKPGESRTVKLSWDADSRSIHAGKEADFSITVHEVKSYEKPALDDAFAALIGPDYDSIDAVRQSVRESIAAERRDDAENQYVTDVLDAVVAQSTLEYPPAVIEDQIDAMVRDTERNLRSYGIESLETYFKQIGEDLDKYRESLRETATVIALRNLVLSELIESEKITVSEKEIDRRIESVMGSVGAEGDDSVAPMAAMLRSSGGRSLMQSEILRLKTIARIVAIARGEEVPEPGTEDEYEDEDEQKAVDLDQASEDDDASAAAPEDDDDSDDDDSDDDDSDDDDSDDDDSDDDDSDDDDNDDDDNDDDDNDDDDDDDDADEEDEEPGS
jgi:trigger factor